MSQKKVPAPWALTGGGYIFLYKFNKDFLISKKIISQKESLYFSGGLGAIMLVDYTSSDVGPYKELLFIPGKFKLGKSRWHKITKIYVSSEDSLVNGRENWGIPKELAKFTFEKIDNKTERIEVYNEKNTFFSTSIKSFGYRFPVNTSFIPFPLMQEYKGQLLQTTFVGKGKGELSKIEDLSVDGEHFPNIMKIKPIIAIKVSDFHITFPKANKY